MIFRNLVKKCLNLDESKRDEIDDLRRELRWAESEMRKMQGHVNVFATETRSLEAKLRKVREVMGGNDEVFSKFSRDQIEDMSIEEFVKLEPLIDQDVKDGKLFLQ